MIKEENINRLTHLKAIVQSMPEKPGTYQYYDSNHNIIYVGKAKNLKTARFFIFPQGGGSL